MWFPDEFAGVIALSELVSRHLDVSSDGRGREAAPVGQRGAELPAGA